MGPYSEMRAGPTAPLAALVAEQEMCLEVGPGRFSNMIGFN